MILRFGANLVFKPHKGKPKHSVNPTVLLDYRCYAPGGKIGTDYPPELTQVSATRRRRRMSTRSLSSLVANV